MKKVLSMIALAAICFTTAAEAATPVKAATDTTMKMKKKDMKMKKKVKKDTTKM